MRSTRQSLRKAKEPELWNQVMRADRVATSAEKVALKMYDPKLQKVLNKLIGMVEETAQPLRDELKRRGELASAQQN